MPGINDDEINIQQTAQFVSSIKISKVNILPYHRTGMDKYGRLGREYRVAHIREPSKGLVKALQRYLKDTD